jgi:hypothetical protein
MKLRMIQETATGSRLLAEHRKLRNFVRVLV